MLNKEICKRCWSSPENFMDDYLWNKGLVVCKDLVSKAEDIVLVQIKENPPINCPYALEHVMENQNVESRNL